MSKDPPNFVLPSQTYLIICKLTAACEISGKRRGTEVEERAKKQRWQGEKQQHKQREREWQRRQRHH